MFLLVFWSAILYQSQAHKWGITVYTTESDKVAQQAEVKKYLATERIPIVSINNYVLPTGWIPMSPLHDGRLSGNETTDFNSGRDFQLKIKLGSDSNLVYISKVRVTSPDNGNQIESLGICRKQQDTSCIEPDKEGEGYWTFKSPELLSEFFMNITFRQDCNTVADFTASIAEVEVLKPSLYGRRVQLPISTDVRSFADAVKKCRTQNVALSTTFELSDTPSGLWIGLFGSSEVPKNDDGAFNTLSKKALDGVDVCGNYTSNGQTECTKAVCSVTEVEYYMRENTSTLTEVCAADRGVPVSPSSQVEIQLIREAFPQHNLIVDACRSKEEYHQIEPTLERRVGDSYNCNDRRPVILTTGGMLENFDHRIHKTASVICKRLPEQLKTNYDDRTRVTGNVPSNISALFDDNLDNDLDLDEFTNTSFTLKTNLSEVRLFTKYNREHENGYAVVKLEKTCETKKEENYKVISLSEESSAKFHQLQGIKCHEQGGSALKLTWPKGVQVTEIQLIKDSIELDIRKENKIGLKTRGKLAITCQVMSVSYAQVTWSCEETCPDDIRTFASASGWTSIITVHETGIYTCKTGTTKNSTYVDWAKTCDTVDLEEFTNGTVKSESKIKVGQKAEIICNTGYTQTNQAKCLEGGTFKKTQSDSVDYCTSTMAKQLEEIETKISGASEEVSEELLATVKENEFNDATEFDTAVELLEKVANKSYDKNGVLANIFEAANTVAKKNAKGPRNLAQVQACLDVVDLIGKNTEQPVFKLAGKGLALTSVQVKRGELKSDVTFAMYNDTTIDHLKFYDWDVDVEGSANAISISSTHANGRMWFTVYDSNTYLTANTASYIIGASFKDNLTPDEKSTFVANVTLQKLYYGAPNTAECQYWDTKAKAWSSEGVTKIKETDEYVVCRTSHLTSFSILMTRDDSFIPKIHKTVLDIISIAGCAVSCICLFLTIIGLARFSHIRQLTDSIIHINFAVALLGALLVFLIFIDFTDYPAICKSGAVILHYLLMVSVSWMFCEALNLYLSVKSIFTNNKHSLLMAAFAWGCPLLIVAFTMLTDFSLENYENPKCCWLKEEAMISWFAIPVILIAIINTVLYVLVLKYIARNASSQKINCISDLRSCFLLLIVLGSTWIFGFFTLLTTKVIFQYLFAISNSLQGFCIFYCYCGSKQYIISAWKLAKEPTPLEEKEFTMESKIVTTKEDHVSKRLSTPIQLITPHVQTTMMKVPTMNNNWYLNDDHF